MRSFDGTFFCPLTRTKVRDIMIKNKSSQYRCIPGHGGRGIYTLWTERYFTAT